MQDPASEFRRITLPRTPVNKGNREGRDFYEPRPSFSVFASLSSLVLGDAAHGVPLARVEVCCGVGARPSHKAVGAEVTR